MTGQRHTTGGNFEIMNQFCVFIEKQTNVYAHLLSITAYVRGNAYRRSAVYPVYYGFLRQYNSSPDPNVECVSRLFQNMFLRSIPLNLD